MFCRKCGKPIENDQGLCSDCAANQFTVSPENTQVEQPAVPVEVTDTFELTDVNEMPAKKPAKKKTGLIAGIAALAVVAAAALGIIFNMGSIKGLIDRTLQSPEEYLVNVESAYVAEHSAALTQSYGTLLENLSANQTTGSAEISLTLDDEILSLVEAALQEQGMRMDLDWLREINMSVNANMQDTAMQMALGLGLGKNDLLSADMVYDIENGKYYLTIPEINKNYLYADVSSQISYDEIKELLSQNAEMRSKLLTALPSEAEMNDLINTYVNVALSCIDNVEKQDDTVTMNGVSQKMVVLTAKVTQKDLLDIAEKILKKAEKDKTLEKVLTALGDFANDMGELNNDYYYPVDYYQEFVDSIPYALDSLEEAKESADNGNYVKLKVYVDMKSAVRGHELAVYSDGKKTGDPISWLTVVDGNVTYTEAELGEARITGKKTEEGDTSEGSYVLYVDDTKLGTLEFENMTEAGATLRLIPSEDILNEALSGSNVPTFLLSDNLALELSYNVQGSNASYSVSILMGSKALISLELSSAASDGGNVSIPSNALDLTSQEDIMQWLKDADFDNLLEAMESCNLPKELVDAARSYVNMLEDQLG